MSIESRPYLDVPPARTETRPDTAPVGNRQPAAIEWIGVCGYFALNALLLARIWAAPGAGWGSGASASSTRPGYSRPRGATSA